MRESRTYGSVRGALRNERPYRDQAPVARSARARLPTRRRAPYTRAANCLPVRPRGVAMSRFGFALRALAVVAAIGALARGSTAAPARHPIAGFYSRQNAQLVIGYPPGGGHHIYRR